MTERSLSPKDRRKVAVKSMKFVLQAVLVFALHAQLGCGGGETNNRASGTSASGTPAASTVATKRFVDPKWPASKRIVGTWRMNAAATLDTALSPEMRKLKEAGKANQIRMEYRITDTEFIVDSYGALGRNQMRWSYEIVKESGNTLLLKRNDTKIDGDATQAELRGDRFMVIGFGPAQTMLERID
jgi:hypothetical protein